MSKKIIFTGPPQVGKTTLRKIFFEGENPTKLLEYSLTPTHGKETILLKLKENVGVFDLAGQENQRWYETEAKSIFLDAHIIICVLDISSPVESLVGFAKKLLKLRQETTPSSFVYLLLHKTDLISSDQLILVEDTFNKEFHDEEAVKIAFTSIMKHSFLPTFTLFTEILKRSIGIDKEKDETFSLKFLEYVVSILKVIEQNVVIPKEDIQRKLRLPEYIFNDFVDYLEKMQFIEISQLNEKSVISLTESGKKYVDEIRDNFSIEAIQKFKKQIGAPKIKETPPFLGFLLADRNGRILMNNEVYEGAFDIFLNDDSDLDKKTELDLIPMFISALEKFAEEINIQDLPGFKLEGSNLKIHTVKYDLSTFCLFMRNDINFETVKVYVTDWVDNMMEVNKTQIERAIQTGIVMDSEQLKSETKKWLERLTQKYNDLVINLEVYDFDHVKKLYQQIDELYSKIDFKYSMTLEKLKKLKVDLMGAALENDYHKVREIVKKIKELDV